MLKAIRYLKPFLLLVIANFVLVFAQVQLELALPDYMSDIVTYGIQYGGITSDTPTVLRASTYEHMQMFMDEEAQAALAENYAYNSETDTYELTDAEADLASVVRRPFLTVSALSQPAMAAQFGADSEEALYTMLQEQPDTAAAVTAAVNAQFADYTEDNLRAAEIMSLKAEYAAAGMDMSSVQSSYIWQAGLKMLGIALLGSLCAIGSSFMASRTATGAARNMRSDVFRKVESFSSEEFSRFSTASLITRTTNDIQQVQMVLTMMLRVVLFAPMMGLTSLLKVLRYPNMVHILGWVIACIMVLLLTQFFVTLPKFKIIQQKIDQLNLVIREQLEGMLVIRAFNNQKYEEKRFDEVNTDITRINRFVNRSMASISPIMTFLMSSVSLLIIWFGARQVDLGVMQVGDIMAFLQYAVHVLMSFMIVAMIFVMIPRSSVSAGRVFEVLETKPSITDPEHPEELPAENQTITFDHVSFRYPRAEADVLSDISFTAAPGETVAIIGSTGSGKSTLVNLIPRFFDVTEGSIRYGNNDIRNVAMKDLREKIGYVPQKATLFSGTVESNLRYADENASPETLDMALSVSQSKEFVERMPHGMEEPIAQGGTNVSGGQKQRLSIARALTRQAQVYIFDDTFSALDYRTDAALRADLNELTAKTKATVLIVAQRISTIMHADRILVLDKGRIVGMGKHDELMQNCDVYQEIAYSQLSREELGA